MISKTLLAVVLFGILVFIHELGHFILAKLSGVFVERFALGFGPAIFKKKKGETEYAICLLPLGGYVKMRGEDPAEGEGKDPRSFAAQSVWTRIAIVAMGPFSNLILPVVVFAVIYMVGMPTPSTRIGQVLPGYPAEKAGLKAGDRILSIDGKAVEKWTDLTTSLQERASKSTALQVDRGGERLSFQVTPVGEPEPNIYGETHLVGKIGIDFQPFRPVVGITDPRGPAAKAGVQTGDVITGINGTPIEAWWQIETPFKSAKLAAVTLSVETPVKDGVAKSRNVELKGLFKSARDLGIEEGELYIREIRPDSVASEKGLKPGDRLVRVNGKDLDGWYAFQRAVRENKGEQIILTIRRDGKNLDVEIVPKEVETQNDITREKQKVRQLGVVSSALASAPDVFIERYLNPFRALAGGIRETYDLSVSTLIGLAKLVRGKLGLNTLGGPISIFYLAGSSFEAGGFIGYFRMIAVLSVTLAILNFLPVPVLDGGHLFFFVIEAIKGSPVSVRIREMAQQVGLVLILGLMALVFYVDINRYFLDRIKALFN